MRYNISFLKKKLCKGTNFCQSMKKLMVGKINIFKVYVIMIHATNIQHLVKQICQTFSGDDIRNALTAEVMIWITYLLTL